MHSSRVRSAPMAAVVFALFLMLTVLQLAVGTFGDLSQFNGKGFGYRLVVYPVLMLVIPVIWRIRHRDQAFWSMPWIAFTLIAAPFLIDVTGNSAGLFDAFDPWDNINHFVNWGLLLGGIGLLIARVDVRPRWVLVVAITGLGAILALGWEIGEWATFIRRGTELHGAYEDTLSDELLGTAGAFVAALIVNKVTRTSGRAPEHDESLTGRS